MVKTWLAASFTNLDVFLVLGDLITDGTWFDTYHSFEDHRRFFQDLAQMYPENAQLFSIGESVEGRPLVGMRIAKDLYEQKPPVVFHGTTHAREWISPAVSVLLHGLEPSFTLIILLYDQLSGMIG